MRKGARRTDAVADGYDVASERPAIKSDDRSSVLALSEFATDIRRAPSGRANGDPASRSFKPLSLGVRSRSESV